MNLSNYLSVSLALPLIDIVLGGGEAERSLESVLGDGDLFDLSYDLDLDLSRLRTGERERDAEREREAERARRFVLVRRLDRLEELLDPESDSESLESLLSLPEELLSLESEAELSLDVDDERLDDRISNCANELGTTAYDRFLRLSFCLSSRIFAAKPDSIASGALDVTGWPDPPNSAGTSTLGPSFAFLGLSSCCVLEGRD